MMAKEIIVKGGRVFVEAEPWVRSGDNFYRCRGCGAGGYAAKHSHPEGDSIHMMLSQGLYGLPEEGPQLRLFAGDEKHKKGCPIVAAGIVPNDTRPEKET